MKSSSLLLGLISGLMIGAVAGSFITHQRNKVAVLSGPYSDYYPVARTEIASAINGLRSGNTNVLEHLVTVDRELKQSEEWTKRFLGK